MVNQYHEDLLKKTEQQRHNTEVFFKKLRDRLCLIFEEIEDKSGHLYKDDKPGKFIQKKWKRLGGGGGLTSIMSGRVFEKVGVHISTVYGDSPNNVTSDENSKILNGKFWATGISVIVHPKNPNIPAVHFNTRMVMTDRYWFGGGADLTPVLEIRRTQEDQDTVEFHKAMEKSCHKHKIANYGKFKKWCDEYFYLKHRNEIRGVGGIFFDNLCSNNIDSDFLFIKSVGNNLIDVYPKIVFNNYEKEWTEENREEQLIRRGRYVEFNLLYDRGTKFGLSTGGNVESILSSLPPIVKWP